MSLRPLLCVACAATLLAPVALARKAAPAPTLAELSAREVTVAAGGGLVADVGQAARSYEAFLRIEGADPAMRAQALRRLGDLRLVEAETQAGGEAGASAAAQAAADAAVAAYRQLLTEQPDLADADTVLYQLARAEEQAGRPETAFDVLGELVGRHPGSVHYPEAQFRRGETYFVERRYVEAEHAYAAVLASGPRSGFAQQARYKHAWSLYKQARTDAAAAAFLTSLDELLVADGRRRPDAELARAERELADDGLRMLAVMFMADEGPRSLEAALLRHGPTSYEANLYAALGDLYVEKERYQDAADAYRAYARRRPMDPQAPLLLVRATEAYARGGFDSLVLDGKRQLVEDYGPSSRFWAAQGADIDSAVVQAVQASLLDLARHHHARAQASGSTIDREAAIRWYREYLAGFDGAPEAPATRLLLADLLFEGHRFEESAAEYEHVAYGYDGGDATGRAGYAALVAYAEAQRVVPDARRAELAGKAIESSLRFAEAFPEHAEVPAVLTRTTKALFDAGDRERAESTAQRVLALGPRADAAQQLVAWTVLAHTWFESARFVEAERAYEQVVRRLPASDPLHAEAVERLAASVYRQAEARKAEGDLRGAVAEFLRVGVVAPTATTRAAAEFDAATLLAELAAWAEAARVLEQFRRNFPGHALETRVTRDLAAAYVNDDRPQQAAREYERVAATASEPAEVRRAARWQAAELDATSGDVAAARRNYAAYVSEYPSPLAPAIDARYELARLAGVAGDGADRARWLDELIIADAGAGPERSDRTRMLAAGAALQLAGPLDAATRALRLTVPLDRSLMVRKHSFEAALAAYGRAADYAIAPVSTTATYAMAELYRDFGRALLGSQRPPDLSPDELEQYDLLLEEQAFPFEEKAIALHERNARRAAAGHWDDGVRSSYAALAELAPGRWARAERASDVDAATAGFAAVADAEAADPFGAALYNQIGIAHRSVGRLAAARAAYERALGADPMQPEAHCNLAVLQDLYLANPRAALPHLERCQALVAGDDGRPATWLVELKARIGQVERTAEVQP